MIKVKWIKGKFYYTFEKDEPVFSKNYFKFYNGHTIDEEGNIVEPFIIDKIRMKVVNNNNLIIRLPSGEFKNGDYVIINDLEYEYSEYDDISTEEDTTQADKENEDIFSEPEGLYQIIQKDNKLLFNKLPDDFPDDQKFEIELRIDEYTNEVYPDHPFRSNKTIFKLNKFHDTQFLQLKKNVIYVLNIIINDEIKYKAKYEADILSYFSNVKALREFIKDLHFIILEKTDEQLHDLIQEKSVLLKRRFGLKKIHVEDPEYFPIFKRVVNLYCVEDLISVSFINGNYITAGEDGTTPNLKLSKFSVGGDEGTDGKALSTDLIRDLITEAEKELYLSLYRKALKKIDSKSKLHKCDCNSVASLWRCTNSCYQL